jgi:dienelactone hydrolase
VRPQGPQELISDGGLLIDDDTMQSALEDAGLCVAAVSIDVRDTPSSSRSAGSTASRLSRVIEQLANTAGTAADRIAVLALTAAASPAVLGTSRDPRVRGFAFLSGHLSASARNVLADWQRCPVLCVAQAADSASVRDMAGLYLDSTHGHSDLMLIDGMRQPDDTQSGGWLASSVARWVRDALSSAGVVRETVFESEDGWRIFGNLVLPPPGPSPAPGVVLLHSGRSDRFALLGLERALAESGFAVLNIDWRGRGQSINKGSYFALSAEERALGSRDAKAAIDHLAGQPGVDSDRICAVGVIHGAEHAVGAALDDSRVKALVLLTGYAPRSERERKFLISGSVRVMYVSCSGHGIVTTAMQGLHEASPPGSSRFVMYEGGAIGYQLLELDERLGPDIVAWLRDAVGTKGPVRPKTTQDPPRASPQPVDTHRPPVPATGVAGPSPVTAGQAVQLKASDGWLLGGTLHRPAGRGSFPGVVLVPGSRHEQDAYGPDIVAMFTTMGVAVLAIDLRGRGASRGTVPLADMAPGQRLDVRLDVASAIDHLAQNATAGVHPICVVTEQDSSAPTLLACADDPRVVGVAVLSPRLGNVSRRAASRAGQPVCIIVSKEDRQGLRDSVDLYTASRDPRNRLVLLDGVGIGTTMFSTWRFEHRDEPPIEESVVSWLASRLSGEAIATSASPVSGPRVTPRQRPVRPRRSS